MPAWDRIDHSKPGPGRLSRVQRDRYTATTRRVLELGVGALLEHDNPTQVDPGPGQHPGL